MDIPTDGPTLVLQRRLRRAQHLRGPQRASTSTSQGHDAGRRRRPHRVDPIDVTALRVLAVATRQASRSGGPLTLRGCGPSVRRMLTSPD